MTIRRGLGLVWICWALAAAGALAQMPPVDAPVAPPGTWGPPGVVPPEEVAPGGPAAPRRPVFWASGEALLWWLKDQALPPLVTTSASQASVGRLGYPDTRVLFGGEVDSDMHPGFRVTAGGELFVLPVGCDRCLPVGLEGSFFLLGHHDNSFSAFSPGDPVLARPFLNALTGQLQVQQVANLRQVDASGNLLVPAVAGQVAVHNPSDLLGSDLYAFFVLNDDGIFRVRLLAGVRYLRLQEEVNVRSDSVQLPDAGNDIPQADFVVLDRFRTRNEFIGGQAGLRTVLRFGAFSLDFQGKVALGSTWQSVRIDGVTSATVPGSPPLVSLGGLLTQATNLGDYSRNMFTVVPEVTVSLGYQFLPCLRGVVGYNFLYWSAVVRPGPNIDLAVNPTFVSPPATGVTGPARPAFFGAGSDLWVQGLNLGLEFTY